MDRRSFITAAIATPLAGSVGAGALAPETEVQRLYRDWEALTGKYNAYDLSWLNGEIPDKQFEALSDPILSCRDQVERKICAAECEYVSDLLIKINIAGHYDWCVDDYQEAIAADALALAA